MYRDPCHLMQFLGLRDRTSLIPDRSHYRLVVKKMLKFSLFVGKNPKTNSFPTPKIGKNPKKERFVSQQPFFGRQYVSSHFTWWTFNRRSAGRRFNCTLRVTANPFSVDGKISGKGPRGRAGGMSSYGCGCMKCLRICVYIYKPIMKKHSLKEQAIPSLHFGDAASPFIAPDVVPFIAPWLQWWGGMPNSLGNGTGKGSLV